MSDLGLKEAVQYLIMHGVDFAEPEVLEINGRTFCTKDLKEYKKPKYKARPLTAHTLTALIDYMKGRKEELPASMIIIVNSPAEVSLISGLDHERERETLFNVKTNTNGFRFDCYYGQEDFIINMQASFVPSEEADLILSVAGNVENKTVANYGDDGTKQKATISRGIAGKLDVEVPNPVTLQPYRTFLEVEQPESRFVFRIREDNEGKPSFKLVEAEGGLWEHKAIERICKFIMMNIPEDIQDRITVIG